MSSRLQLDVRNLSLRRNRLVDAYEVKEGTDAIAGKTCAASSSIPESIECELLR